MDTNLASYLESIASINPNLTHKDEIRLIKRYKELGDVEARNLVITNNLKFVVYMVKPLFKQHSVEPLELINVGNEALFKAVESFNTDAGVAFCSWAGMIVFTAAQRCLVKNSQLMTHGLHQMRRKVLDASSKLDSSSMSDNEMIDKVYESIKAEIHNVERKEVEHAYFYKEPVSVDETLNLDGQQTKMLETIEDSRAYDMIENVENRMFISQAMSKLNDREKYVIYKHYFDGKTFDEIGASINMTRQGAQQLKNKALVKMQSIL